MKSRETFVPKSVRQEYVGVAHSANIDWLFTMCQDLGIHYAGDRKMNKTYL